tara:strand:- start:1387 stop:1587 length:201 start_codon:yes stop_codon:yes gene_type:complete
MKEKGELSELMEHDDWALIFGPDGKIKGIFIPDGRKEEDVPDQVLYMLEAAGINLFEPEEEIVTLH